MPWAVDHINVAVFNESPADSGLWRLGKVRSLHAKPETLSVWLVLRAAALGISMVFPHETKNRFFIGCVP